MIAIRLAVRALRRSAGFTTTAVLLIGLSVGAVTTIGGAVHAVLARPLQGIASTADLAWVTVSSPTIARPQGISYPDFVDYREAGTGVLTGSALYEVLQLGVAGGSGDPARVTAHLVGGDYFSLFGVAPAVGRLFSQSELQPGSEAPLLVVGHAFWRARLGADPGIVGKPLLVNGRPFTVIGVAAPGFAGPELGAAADAWLPLGGLRLAAPARADAVLERARSALTMVVRTDPDLSPETVQQVLAPTAGRLSAAFPDSHRDLTVRVTPMRGGLPPGSAAEAVPVAALVLVVAGLVLLIAYTNLVGLQLTRALQRRREHAILLAIGAGRLGLFRQALAETVVLSVMGGVVGALVAMWAADLIRIGGDQFRGLATTPQPWTVTGALAVSLAVGLIAGALPAWIASRRDLMEALKESTPASPGGRRRVGLRSAFVVAQQAMSLVLSFAALQFGLALLRAQSVDLGFRPDGVSAVSFDPALQNYSRARRDLFERELVARVTRLPGVASAALANAAPLSGVMAIDQLSPADAAGTQSAGRPTGLSGVSEGYFDTLGIPLRRGRPFNSRDHAGAPAVTVINETAASQLWPGEEAVGRLVKVGDARQLVEVIGVVADARYDEPTERRMPFAYFPLAQRHVLDQVTLLARSATSDPVGPRVLGEAVRALDPALPVFDGATLQQVIAARLDRQSAIGGLLSLLGIAGLLISGIGLYGVMAYSVTRRRREIGIRLALGGTPGQVLRLVVGAGLRLTAGGVVLGTLLALPVAALLTGEVFGLRVGQVGSLLGAALVLVAVSVTATVMPARRAARVPPMDALRAE